MRSISLEVALEETEVASGALAPVTRIGPRPQPPDWLSVPMDCEARTSYDVRFADLFHGPALQEALADRKALLVTTPTVDRLYGAAMREALRKTNTVSTLVLDVREETKSMKYVEAVCAEAMAHGLNRKGLLIGFGGGVCLDVVTVAASLIRRGVGHLRVPTTLIGQIDAGIGLKGAVNFAGKKSFIGCFHPPEQVLVDPSLLRSLPRRAISSGFAESIKMGVIRDAALFELLEKSDCVSQEMLRLSIWSMLEELRKNPYEDQSYERVVDFGHTFSPLLEAAMGFELQHGEAVAIDIALSTMISHELGLIDAAVRDRILTVMRAAGLPIFAPKLELALCKEALTEAARHRGGAMNLVIPDGIGRAAFLRQREELPDDVLAKALSSLGAAST